MSQIPAVPAANFRGSLYHLLSPAADGTLDSEYAREVAASRDAISIFYHELRDCPAVIHSELAPIFQKCWRLVRYLGFQFDVGNLTTLIRSVDDAERSAREKLSDISGHLPVDHNISQAEHEISPDRMRHLRESIHTYGLTVEALAHEIAQLTSQPSFPELVCHPTALFRAELRLTIPKFPDANRAAKWLTDLFSNATSHIARNIAPGHRIGPPMEQRPHEHTDLFTDATLMIMALSEEEIAQHQYEHYAKITDLVHKIVEAYDMDPCLAINLLLKSRTYFQKLYDAHESEYVGWEVAKHYLDWLLIENYLKAIGRSSGVDDLRVLLSQDPTGPIPKVNVERLKAALIDYEEERTHVLEALGFRVENAIILPIQRHDLEKSPWRLPETDALCARAQTRCRDPGPLGSFSFDPRMAGELQCLKQRGAMVSWVLDEVKYYGVVTTLRDNMQPLAEPFVNSLVLDCIEDFWDI